MFENLDAVHADVASRLAEGASRRQSPLHVPVVGTDGGDMRVMVLRAFDPARWQLRFHTDARSPKARAIGQGAPVGVLFYDPAAKIQIRTRGSGRIESDGPIAQAAWEASTNFARRCYLGDGPGAVVPGPTSGLPAEFEGVEPDEGQLVPARENFAVLLVTLHHLDWLYLAHDGHRRAQFDLSGDAGWQGRWVTP
jgi:hypothetical protein